MYEHTLVYKGEEETTTTIYGDALIRLMLISYK